MTISIVAQLAASPRPAGPHATRTDEPLNAGAAGRTADFASLLVAPPTDKTCGVRLPDGAPREEEATTQCSSDGQAALLMANLGPTLVPPHVRIALDNPHDRPTIAGEPTDDAASALAGQRISALAAGIGEQAASDRQTLLQALAVGEQQPAKLAASDIAATTPDRHRPGLPEATSSALLATLPLPAGSSPYAPLGTAHPQHELATPLGHAAWGDDFAQKLLWFSGNDRQQAQLTLNPPQLGQIEITLNIDKDVTSAHFASAYADVRSTIESSLPRLREMFAGAGVELGQVTVGSESHRQPPEARQDAAQSPRGRADKAILGVASGAGQQVHTLATQRGNALVDLFV